MTAYLITKKHCKAELDILTLQNLFMFSRHTTFYSLSIQTFHNRPGINAKLERRKYRLQDYKTILHVDNFAIPSLVVLISFSCYLLHRLYYIFIDVLWRNVLKESLPLNVRFCALYSSPLGDNI